MAGRDLAAPTSLELFDAAAAEASGAAGSAGKGAAMQEHRQQWSAGVDGV